MAFISKNNFKSYTSWYEIISFDYEHVIVYYRIIKYNTEYNVR